MKQAAFIFVLLLKSLSLWSNPELLQREEKIISKAIENFMHHTKAPGIAVALFYEDQGKIYTFGYADRARQIPVRNDTIFELASITKVFTSTSLALEVLKGRMQLNDKVAEFLPILRVDRGIGRVNLLQLATHTSSLPRMPEREAVFSKQILMRFLRDWKPSKPIGTHYLYSNLGFGLLGIAIASQEGMPFQDVIQEQITNPLGMRSTFFHVPEAFMSHYAQGYTVKNIPTEPTPVRVLLAAGALRSTIQDMLKFLEANLGISGPTPLRKAMQFAQRDYFHVNEHLTMGLGWQLFHDRDHPYLIIDKNGGLKGFSSYIGMMPEKKMGIVILANKAKTHVTDIGRKILYSLAKD